MTFASPAMVPVAAGLTAMAADRLLERMAKPVAVTMLGLFFVALAWWSYVWIKPKYDPWGAPLWAVGRELDRIAPSGALVAVADVGDPTAI